MLDSNGNAIVFVSRSNRNVNLMSVNMYHGRYQATKLLSLNGFM